MTRKLKALGICLAAVFALGAVGVAEASASENIFDTEPLPTFTLTGTSENTQIFTRSGVKIECTHVKFQGTIVGTSLSNIHLNPEYTTPTCSGPIGSEVHVDFTGNNCFYNLVGTASKTATVTLQCNSESAGVLLTPTVFGSSICTITIPPQETGGHVVFTNTTENGKGSITAESTISGLESTRTGSSSCGNENDATGTYTGNYTITGYTDVNGSEGEQTNIEVT